MQTNIGRDARAALIAGVIVEVAMGTDDTPPTGADVALGNETEREVIDTIIPGATGITTVRTRFGAGVAGTFVETGTFEVGGDMHDRFVHSPVAKPGGVELVVDIRFEVQNV